MYHFLLYKFFSSSIKINNLKLNIQAQTRIYSLYNQLSINQSLQIDEQVRKEKEIPDFGLNITN